MTQNQLDADARALITAERNAIVQIYARDGVAGARAIIAGEMRVPGPLAMMLTGPGERLVVGNVAAWPAGVAADNRFTQVAMLRTGHRTPETFATSATPLPGGYRLLIGRSVEEQQRLTETLTTSLVAAVGLALALALGVAYLLARTIAARVQGIADVAGAVAAGDLSRRVDAATDGTGDAFDALGGALNAMLARIEALLDELRSVTDGLAHDLRSPLTRMKARIDRLTRASDGHNAEVAGIGAEADALLAMLETSLEISRVEAGIGRDSFTRMDLAALVVDMVDMYEPLAEDSGVHLTALAATSVPVLAHRELLGRALSNLIDNALRYGASGGEIEVAAVPTADGAQLAVCDRGPGIASASHDDALRRFGRLNAARPAGGAGLGLSLAAAIARLHGGRLTLKANQPGLKVIIDLPART
ncbi:sensor histidine kinase [Sandarakinorhabdus sp. DWP1-3-1]|uniref:sensor histidine kinase n=1 Tax=Sandarakinorhabdus sp. DWP1-3-1 TaxID=2804627 RepID=UPI003CF58968